MLAAIRAAISVGAGGPLEVGMGMAGPVGARGTSAVGVGKLPLTTSITMVSARRMASWVGPSGRPHLMEGLETTDVLDWERRGWRAVVEIRSSRLVVLVVLHVTRSSCLRSFLRASHFMCSSMRRLTVAYFPHANE